MTKSKYVTGLQCPKLLWMQVKRKIPKRGEIEERRLEEGVIIGEAAKKAFPEGVDLAGLDFNLNIEKTEEAIRSGRIIFEAGLLDGDCFSRVDILVPARGGWDIVEVKGSTEVKEQHIPDVAFQKFCAKKNGLKVGKCFVMHLNKEYVRKGDIEPKKLFVKTDVSADVDDALREVPGNARRLVKVLDSKRCPEASIGPHCSDPYGCPVEVCWDFLPENNVCDLYRIRAEKAFELISDGVYSIKDVPKEFNLSSNQQIQKECELTGKPHIDKPGIRDFLEELKYPLHFLDFETFNTGIPMFDGLKPYQQVPFQFSLHTVRSRGAKPKHAMFLAEGKEDPRREFLVRLKRSLGTRGSVVVYNQAFETRILKELAGTFPKQKAWFKKVCGRVVDLLVPFRSFDYYSPKQQGSASIKDVLPALTRKSYKGMEIADGGAAGIAFIKATYEDTSEKEKKKLRKALRKYCTMDTDAMIKIVEKLEKLSDK